MSPARPEPDRPERFRVAKQQRRKGRGQLSSIDLLPEEADEAVAWADAQLRDRTMPQQEILRQFNAMLADHGIGPISRSAFSRHSVGIAIEMRKMNAFREINDAVMANLDPLERSDEMIAATEMAKWRLMQLIRTSDDNPKLLLEATLALQRLSSIAVRESELQRRDRKEQRAEDKVAAEREEQARRAVETADKVERIAEEAGLGADRIAAIRRGVLGLAT